MGAMLAPLTLTLLYGPGAVGVVILVIFLVAVLRIRDSCTEMSQSLKEIAAAMKAGPRP